MTLFEKSEKSSTLSGFRKAIGETFSKFGLSPNQWTIVSLVVAVIAAAFIVSGQYVLGAVFIVLSGFIDLIDGAVARYTGRVTKEGAYIDTVTDRYNELIYILPLAFLINVLPSFLLPFSAWLLLYIFGAMMTTYAKAAAKEKELGVAEIRGGIVERAERVSIYAIGLLLAPINILYLSYAIVILAILVNVSALQRIKKTLDSLHSKKEIAETKHAEEEVVAAVKFEKKGKFDERTIGTEEEEKEEPKRIVVPKKKEEEKRKGQTLKI